MAERNLIIDRQKFSYEGLFNPAELYNVIQSWFFEKAWDWYEELNHEEVTPEGKQIRLVLEPWKSVTDYYKLIIAMKVIMSDLKEVEVEKNGETLRLHHGLVKITFDGIVLSDRNDLWTEKPFYWLITILKEKYFLRHHFDKMEIWVKSDLDDLQQKIKTYLNTFKYTYQK